MKSIKGPTALLVFLLIGTGVFGYFFNDYLSYKKQTIVQKNLDGYLKDLFEQLKERKNIVLTSALLLADNRDIKECLKSEERSRCIDYLKHIQKTFQKISFSKDINIHMHTKDFKSFFRVWDLNSNKHDSLASFRESLQSVKESKIPLAGVEIGRYSMMIRGIAPIYDKDEYNGSIEVVSNFNKITKYFRTKGVDFFVLMDKKYEKVASMLKYGISRRFNHYIIVNNVNSSFDIFRDIQFKDTGFLQKEGFYILYTPIYSFSNKKIGFYVLKIPEQKL
jgi:hypothetical protein